MLQYVAHGWNIRLESTRAYMYMKYLDVLRKWDPSLSARNQIWEFACLADIQIFTMVWIRAAHVVRDVNQSKW